MKPIRFQPAHRNRLLLITAAVAEFITLFIIFWIQPALIAGNQAGGKIIQLIGLILLWVALAAKWRPKPSEVTAQPELVQFAVKAADHLRIGLTQVNFDDGAAPAKDNATLKIPQAYLTLPDQAFARAGIAYTLATDRLTVFPVSILAYIPAITAAMAYTPREHWDVLATIALAIPVATVLYVVLTWRRRHTHQIRQAIEIAGDQDAMRRYIESRGWSKKTFITSR